MRARTKAVMPKPLRGTAGLVVERAVWSLSPRYLPWALRTIAYCEGIVTGGTTLPLQERNKIPDDDAYHAGDVLGFGRSRSATPDYGQKSPMDCHRCPRGKLHGHLERRVCGDVSRTV